jgi:tetratricopeptide (TPR) repeat protein
VELSLLRERLVGDGTAVALPLAVHGLGGVGKTQLAVEYAFRHRFDYDLVWWIPAEEPASAVASLARLAQRCGVAVEHEAEESARAAVGLLAAGRRYPRWLLVLDNATEPEDVFGILAAAEVSGGHVLVTSRDGRWSGLAGTVEVDVLSRPDAVRLLRGYVPDLDDSNAERLAAELGYLPLAVEQAGAFLAETGMTASEYADLLTTRLRALMRAGTRKGVRPVAATWTATLHALGDPAVVALARLWAHFGPEPIPVDLVCQATATLLPDPLCQVAADGVSLAGAVGRLVRLAVVRRVGDAVVMHRLVQAVLRDDTPESERDKIRAAVHRILGAAAPTKPSAAAPIRRYIELYPHVLATNLTDVPDDGARRLVIWTILCLTLAGDYANSRLLAERARRQWSEALGEDHPFTLTAVGALAGVLLAQGHYEAARAMYADLYARQRALHGEDHPITLAAAGGLANALLAQGHYAAAQAMLDDIHTRALDLGGEDDFYTIAFAGGRALASGAQGNYATAQAMLDDIYTRMRMLAGENNPLTLGAASGLAGGLLALGQYTTAQTMFDDVYSRLQSKFGKDHPDTLAVANGLADTLHSRGDYAKARALRTEVLTGLQATLGEDHPNTLIAAHNLAVTSHAEGDYASARATFEDVLARRRTILGEEHPETLTAAQNLAVTMHAQGHHAEARALLDNVLPRRQASLANDHPDALMSAQNLAVTLHAQGDYAGSRALLDDVLPRLRERLGEDHPSTITAAHNLAGTLYALGDHAAAQAMFTDVLARRRALLGEDHPDTLTTAHNLAVALYSQGDVTAARAMFADVHARSRAGLGEDHPTTVNARRALADTAPDGEPSG